MRNLIIIGNSGAARECYWLVREVMQQHGDIQFKGFLSFEGYKGELRELADLELGNDDNFYPAKNDVLVIGIGHPALRAKAYAKWKARGRQFINLKHPSAIVSPSVEIGEGNIITSACYFSCNVQIGNANYFNGGNTLGHDVIVGDTNFFGPFSFIMGNVSIGSGNSFGVYSVVLVKAKVGDNNTIAPGAYVYKGCKNNAVMSGNPAINIA